MAVLSEGEDPRRLMVREALMRHAGSLTRSEVAKSVEVFDGVFIDRNTVALWLYEDSQDGLAACLGNDKWVAGPALLKADAENRKKAAS